MQRPGIIDEEAAAIPCIGNPASPRWIPEDWQDLAHPQAPEHTGATAELSWEQILVDAGLDRESREMSPAERVLADRLAESGYRCGLIYRFQEKQS